METARNHGQACAGGVWSGWLLPGLMGHSENIYPSLQRHLLRQPETARMEVLKEKVEEEEAAEREEAAEWPERMEKTRPAEVQKEETIMSQEMLRDLERKLSEIKVPIPAEPP